MAGNAAIVTRLFWLSVSLSVVFTLALSFLTTAFMWCWVRGDGAPCCVLHPVSVAFVITVSFDLLSFAFSPPFVKVVRVVAKVHLRVDLRDLEVRVSLKTLVRIQLYKLGKGESALDVLIDAGGMCRFVRAFIHCIKKPINFLLFYWWLVGTVVGHFAADVFKKINMFDNACPIDVS